MDSSTYALICRIGFDSVYDIRDLANNSRIDFKSKDKNDNILK